MLEVIYGAKFELLGIRAAMLDVMLALPGLGTTLGRGRRWQKSPVTEEREGNR